MSGDVAARAARVGDQVSHGLGYLGMLAGAAAGVAIGAAMVTATAATGGMALLAIAGGCVAGGGLSGGALVRGIMKAMDLPDPTTGMLLGVSPCTVLINHRPAIRANVDIAALCNGLSNLNHYPAPAPVIEGAMTVLIDGMPAGRVGMKLVCGAAIKSGSSDVVIGGPTQSFGTPVDAEAVATAVLQALGFVSMGAGALLAAEAGGALALGTFLAGGALLGEAFDQLHDFGESLGPGYGDILTGLAGFALMLGGVKLGRRARRAYEKSLESRSAKGDKSATYEFNKIKQRRAQAAGDADGAKGYRAENKIIDREGDNVVEAGRKVSYEDPNKPGKRLETDIDVETKTEVIQVKAGSKMPSPNQTGATRMRAEETGKEPKVIYDDKTMPKGAVKKFQKDNPDFVLEGTDLS